MRHGLRNIPLPWEGLGEGLLVRSAYSVPKNSNSWSAPYSDKARLVPTFGTTKRADTMVCPYYTCAFGRANPAPTEDPPLQAYIPFPWGGLGRGLLHKRAPQIGLPFIGGEIYSPPILLIYIALGCCVVKRLFVQKWLKR